MNNKMRGRLLAVLTAVGLVFGSAIVASPASANATPLLSGSSWFGTNGVNVCGASTDTNCGTEAHVGGVSTNWWQCVEMAQRFYKKQGWYTASGGIFSGINYAYEIYDNASSLGMSRQANGSITSIVPGDMIIHAWNNPGSGGAGHVSIVDSISGSTINVVEQNGSSTGRATYTLSGGTLSQGSSIITGVVDDPDNVTMTTPTPTYGAGGATSLPGKWTSTSTGDDLAYVTKNSDGGFDVAIFKQTSSGLVWQGIWWTQAGSSGVLYDNTMFFAADANGDGLLDLYYSTGSNWNTLGVGVSLMQNMGGSFSWAGEVFSNPYIKLAETQFLPGDWVGNGRDGFAYVTKTPSGGFDVTIISSTTSGYTWQGIWWTQAGSSGVRYDNTFFFSGDNDGDGKRDLFYSTASNWNNLGVGVSLMMSTGSTFNWAGEVFSNPYIKLAETRFLPGDWVANGRDAFAYVTKNSDGGFDVSVVSSTTSGMVWQGIWWTSAASSGVQYYNTRFSPLDTDSDGRTDLLYTTALSWDNWSFTTGLAHNTGSSLLWGGTQWEATFPLNKALLIPQR